jgi:hypothetical protein
MKKSKKTTAAKPLSRRRSSSRAKPGAKTLKAAKSPKKRSVRKSPLAKKPAKAESTTKTKPAAEPKRKRLTKAKGTIASEVAPEPKPIEPPPPPIRKKSIASAKAAPKSTLLAMQPVPKAKAMAKLASMSDAKPPAKAIPAAKPESTSIKPAPKSEPKSSEEPPAEEKPEFGVEFLFEAKSKPFAKPKAKIKRVAKPKAATENPALVEAKPETKATPKEETKAPKPVSSAPPPEGKRPSRPARKAPAKIPPILLEGDKPEPALVSGPGHRYALGPTAPVEKLPTEGELPESYGTGTILLTARDPHWLYTHWDLTGDQQRRFNAFSRDGHLIVRIYIDAPRGKPVAQAHVHPESRHWFVHVGRANTRYDAELGYYTAADKWTVVSTSAPTLTPPDAVSADTTAEFGTMPCEVPMEKLLSLVKEAVQENAPLAEALQELREEGHTELPHIEVRSASAPEPNPARSEAAVRAAGKKTQRPRWTPSEWTPAQERALAEVVSMDHVRRVWMGSLEITELIRRQFINELASTTAAELGVLAPGAPTSPAGAITGISSPTTKPGHLEKGFWFNVNAELIVYGATESDATVSIGGRKIKLRPDGSFSYRFALPDGNYEMPVVAISADQTDGRAAELKFSRSTEYRGDVGAHPQDPSLQQLILENF